MALVDNESERGSNAPELDVGFEVGRYVYVVQKGRNSSGFPITEI